MNWRSNMLRTCFFAMLFRHQCAAFVLPAGSPSVQSVQGLLLLTGRISETVHASPTPCHRQSQLVHHRPMAHVLQKGMIGARQGLAVGAARNLSGEPTKLAAVVYKYVDGMMEKRGPHRSEHLALLKTATEEGACLLGGAYVEPCDGAFLLFSSPDQAKQFVEKDPYSVAGLVASYQIRDYMAVVGTMLK